MGELARFTVCDQESVVFEIEESSDGIRQAGLRRNGKILDTNQVFESKLVGIRDAAASALAVLKDGLGPDEVILKFGIKMTAEAGAVVARTAIEGNMAVEMSWRREATAAVEPGTASAEESE